jgi:hypothetical protein
VAKPKRFCDDAKQGLCEDFRSRQVPGNWLASERLTITQTAVSPVIDPTRAGGGPVDGELNTLVAEGMNCPSQGGNPGTFNLRIPWSTGQSFRLEWLANMGNMLTPYRHLTVTVGAATLRIENQGTWQRLKFTLNGVEQDVVMSEVHAVYGLQRNGDKYIAYVNGVPALRATIAGPSEVTGIMLTTGCDSLFGAYPAGVRLVTASSSPPTVSQATGGSDLRSGGGGERRDCDLLVSKACTDLGQASETCRLVETQTKAFPPERCSKMLTRYHEVIADLRRMEEAKQSLDPAEQALIVADATLKVNNESSEAVILRLSAKSGTVACRVSPRGVSQCTVPPGVWGWSAEGGENIVPDQTGSFAVDAGGVAHVSCIYMSRIMTGCMDGTVASKPSDETSAIGALGEAATAVAKRSKYLVKAQILLPLTVAMVHTGGKEFALRTPEDVLASSASITIDPRFVTAAKAYGSAVHQGEANCSQRGPMGALIDWSKGPNAVKKTTDGVTVSWIADPCTDHAHRVVVALRKHGPSKSWKLASYTTQSLQR